MTTPIDRLREAHRPCSVPCFTHSLLGDRAHCWQWGEPWPCDTIAALDALEERLAEYRKTATNMRELHDQLDDENEALQARLDAATVLIREVDTLLRVLDTRMCGTRLSHFCDFSEPRMRVREWLAGDKEEHGEQS